MINRLLEEERKGREGRERKGGKEVRSIGQEIPCNKKRRRINENT